MQVGEVFKGGRLRVCDRTSRFKDNIPNNSRKFNLKIDFALLGPNTSVESRTSFCVAHDYTEVVTVRKYIYIIPDLRELAHMTHHRTGLYFVQSSL